VLLGLLRDSGALYVGHPNGDVAWTRNLDAAGSGILAMRPAVAVPVRAARLADGPERDRAILATSQHVFPGNLIYRLARRHILVVGAYFRLEVGADTVGAGGGDGVLGSDAQSGSDGLAGSE